MVSIIKRRFVALVALVMATIALSACGANSPTGPTPDPTTTPPPAGSTPNWATALSPTCTVNPTPAAPDEVWKAKVMVRVNQGGLSYKSEWFLNGKLVGTPVTGTTQATPETSMANGDYAPKQVGTYLVVWQLTESFGDKSNTISAQCNLVVQKPAAMVAESGE